MDVLGCNPSKTAPTVRRTQIKEREELTDQIMMLIPRTIRINNADGQTDIDWLTEDGTGVINAESVHLEG